MSDLPPKADICSAPADVCFGPKADICSALSHAPLRKGLTSQVPSVFCSREEISSNDA
jgi:hypothetical protein